jgi:hypothetical protein
MGLLAFIPLLIIIILLMIAVLYFHTMAIKEQIKDKTLNITTLIYDVFIYVLIVGIIGFCLYYIISF